MIMSILDLIWKYPNHKKGTEVTGRLQSLIYKEVGDERASTHIYKDRMERAEAELEMWRREAAVDHSSWRMRRVKEFGAYCPFAERVFNEKVC